MIALSYAQVVAGCSLPYLKEVMTNSSYVLPLWLSNIRTFLCLCKGKIIIPASWLPHQQWEHDQILMDVFKSMKLSTFLLEKLNAVQLYLGVLTLADIVSDDGKYIQPWALMGSSRAKPMLPWPNQGMQSDSSWTMWRRFSKKCFAPTTSKNHHLHKPIKLQQQLGEWKT
eukprot:9426332-Ditylum_brightwellii.AAC.1